jgi:hypothetical protein
MGLAGFRETSSGENRVNLLNASTRRAFSTLMMPGGLGSTMKVLIMGKGVGAPRLAGLSCGTRMT